MTPTLFQRLHEMFASKPDHSDDRLQELLFSRVKDCVEQEDCFNTVAWSSLENGHSIKDCISDAYIYISHDRQLLLNKLIEAELGESQSLLDEYTEELEEQDNYALKLIVEHRKFLFN